MSDEEAMKRHPSYTEPVDETNEPEWVMDAGIVVTLVGHRLIIL